MAIHAVQTCPSAMIRPWSARRAGRMRIVQSGKGRQLLHTTSEEHAKHYEACLGKNGRERLL